MDDISVVYPTTPQQQCNTSNAVTQFLNELCQPNGQQGIEIHETKINMIVDGVLRFVSTRSELFSRQNFPNFKKVIDGKLTSWEKIYRTTKIRDLFIAVKSGNMETVRKLVEKEKIDVNSSNPSAESNRSLIEVALRQRTPQIPISLYLIEKGAKINGKIGSHESLLHYCCAYGFLDIVKVIVGKKTENINQHTPGIGITPLHLSCANGQTEVTEYLLQNGAGESVTIHDETNGQTPLHIACGRLDLRTTKLLLENKAEPKAKAKDDLNCLQLLCSIAFPSGDNTINTKKELQVEMAKLLMTADKLIAVCTDNMDNSCLHRACTTGNAKLVNLLVQSNVPVNSKNKFGRTPLWVLFEMTPGPLNDVRTPIFQELINNKADVACVLEDGTSLLHHTAKYNDIPSAVTLITNGIDLFLRNSWKQTSRDLAMSLGFHQFVLAIEKATPQGTPPVQVPVMQMQGRKRTLEQPDENPHSNKNSAPSQSQPQPHHRTLTHHPRYHQYQR